MPKPRTLRDQYNISSIALPLIAENWCGNMIKIKNYFN